jgi:hypothetical protein
MHASAFLVPGRPIAEFKHFCLNGIELRSRVYTQMPEDGFDPSTFSLRKSYPSFRFQFKSFSVEFQCAQAAFISTPTSSYESILHGRSENLQRSYIRHIRNTV